MESKTSVLCRLEKGLEFNNATELSEHLNVFWILAAVNHLLNDVLSVNTDAKFFCQIVQISVNQLIYDYLSRTQILLCFIILNKKMNVFFTLLSVQVILRIVVHFILTVINFTRMTNHTQVNLKVTDLISYSLVLVSSKYNLPPISHWLRTVGFQNLFWKSF